MKLNLECCRDIMLYIEENQGLKSNGIPESFHARDLPESISEKYGSDEIVYYNLKQLYDGKYISLKDPNCSPRHYVVSDITPKGHEFIATIRSDKIWKKILKYFQDHSTETMISLVPVIAETFINQALGIK